VIPGRRLRLWDEPDGSLTYGHWHDDSEGEWVEPDYVGYSDYSGSLVERSNYEEFVEQFADSEDIEWFRVHGGHGTTGVIIRVDADERVPEIGEFFEALENYPLVNEDRHSELEREVEQEGWESYGRSDFRRWMRQVDLPTGVLNWDDLVDDLTDEQLDTLWVDAVQSGSGEEVSFENQSTVFNFDRAFRNRSIVEEVQEILGVDIVDFTWGDRLRRFLRSVFSGDGRLFTNREFVVILDDLSDKTLAAFFEHLLGKRRADPRKPLDTIKMVLTPLMDWSEERWAVLFDAMLEEGPEAFTPRGAGQRAMGRR